MRVAVYARVATEHEAQINALENSIARQRERLDKYIDLCADGIITKQELAERRKGLEAQIAELQSQYENVEQEDECSGTLDMNLIAQKLDEWQKASRNDVDRELVNSCPTADTPLWTLNTKRNSPSLPLKSLLWKRLSRAMKSTKRTLTVLSL